MVKGDRDTFITDNIGLVHSIAKRFNGRGVEYDDLYQAGCIGLIKAVDNFDEEKGFAFSTYAVPVIMGEMKRLFRDGGAIKVSRSLKEKSLKLGKARENYISKNLKEPTVSELSELTGYTLEEVSEIFEVLTPVQSLSIIFEDESETMDIPCDNSNCIFERLMIYEAENKLTETEQKIIKLRYFTDMTQSETAKILGMSQVQVSRREKAILLKLREYMK